MGIVAGSMDGQSKTRIINGKFDYISVNYYKSIILASTYNILTKYEYNGHDLSLRSLIHPDDFYSTECINIGRSIQSIDAIVYIDYGLYSIRNIHSLFPEAKLKYSSFEDFMNIANIFFTVNNMLIGIKYIFVNKRPSIVFVQHVYTLNEDLKHLKIIDERKDITNFKNVINCGKLGKYVSSEPCYFNLINALI